MARAPSDGPAQLGVVVPTLDEAEILPALLTRLFEGAEPDDRADVVVVADGGSRDGTPALARRLGALVVTAPRGRGAQLAAGAASCESEIVLFLHADCVPAAGALAALRRAFRDPGLWAAAMSQRIGARGAFYRLVERAADARVRRGMVYGDSCLAVRRAAYVAAGGFRPLPLFEDVDLAKRLRRVARPRLVEEARAVVSPRRWQREGPLACTLRNWALRLLYEAGVAPAHLTRLYPPHDVP